MSLKKRLMGYAVEAYVSESANNLRRRAAAVSRRVRNQPDQLEVYLCLEDPYSYLLAQAIKRLHTSYGIAFSIKIVTGPASDVDPQPELRRAYAVRDARELADYYDVDFPPAKPLDKVALQRGNAILIHERGMSEQLEAFLAVADAAWRADSKDLATVRGRYGDESSGGIEPVLNTNYSELRKRGHYYPAMVHYDGDWFWGIDRLSYLEDRLRAATGLNPAPVVNVRPIEARGAKELTSDDGPLTVQMFHSFRSPYSYLAIDRAFGVCDDLGAHLEVRPILPMVDRGATLSRDKMLYIVRDASRLATSLGVPFGRICDPRGEGIAHCLAAWPVAQASRRRREYLTSIGNGIWAEGRDVSDPEAFLELATRAGLAADEVRAALKSDSWRAAAEANAKDLKTYGHWGVPTFLVGNFMTWGQDRVDLLRDRLRRHRLAVAARREAAGTAAVAE